MLLIYFLTTDISIFEFIFLKLCMHFGSYTTSLLISHLVSATDYIILKVNHHLPANQNDDGPVIVKMLNGGYYRRLIMLLRQMEQ